MSDLSRCAELDYETEPVFRFTAESLNGASVHPPLDIPMSESTWAQATVSSVAIMFRRLCELTDDGHPQGASFFIAERDMRYLEKLVERWKARR